MSCFILFHLSKNLTAYSHFAVYTSIYFHQSVNFQSAWVIMAHIIISTSKVAESYPSTQKVGARERGEDSTLKEELESGDQGRKLVWENLMHQEV